MTDLPCMPWKNGGGSTREVVCQPLGAGMDGFDWRVSIASITRSGPFSVFPGVERSILLLEGDGVHLHAQGHFEHRLDARAQPFAFAGDVPVDCTLLGAPSTDFNVMTRRGVACADVQAHRHPVTLAPAPAGVLLALQGGWLLSAGTHTLEVSAGQGIWWADALTAWACREGRPQPSHPNCDPLLVSVRITPGRAGKAPSPSKSQSDLRMRRLQLDRSDPFFTVFVPHSKTMGLPIQQKLSSLGPNFASTPQVRQAPRELLA